MEAGPIIFSARQKRYLWGHVLSSACWLGRAASLHNAARASLICELYATEERYTLNDTALQEAADLFRQENGLFSAGATMDWLSGRGLDKSAFSAFFSRQLWKKKFQDRIHDIAALYQPSPEAIRDWLYPEALLGGNITALGRDLAARVALQIESGGSPAAEKVREIRQRLAEIALPEHPHGASPDGQPWLEEFAALEAHFQEFREKSVSKTALEQALDGKHLALTRVRLERALFPTHAAAEEAGLCVSMDAEPLEEIASRTGALYHIDQVFIDETGPGLQQLLISGRVGQLLPPFEQNGAFHLVRLLGKTLPSFQDQLVKDRLQHAILTPLLDRVVNEHIEWAWQQ